MLSSNGWVSSEQKDEDGAESFQAEDGHRESQASDGDIEGQALGLPVDGSHGPCDSDTEEHVDSVGASNISNRVVCSLVFNGSCLGGKGIRNASSESNKCNGIDSVFEIDEAAEMSSNISNDGSTGANEYKRYDERKISVCHPCRRDESKDKFPWQGEEVHDVVAAGGHLLLALFALLALLLIVISLNGEGISELVQPGAGSHHHRVVRLLHHLVHRALELLGLPDPDHDPAVVAVAWTTKKSNLFLLREVLGVLGVKDGVVDTLSLYALCDLPWFSDVDVHDQVLLIAFLIRDLQADCLRCFLVAEDELALLCFVVFSFLCCSVLSVVWDCNLATSSRDTLQLQLKGANRLNNLNLRIIEAEDTAVVVVEDHDGGHVGCTELDAGLHLSNAVLAGHRDLRECLSVLSPQVGDADVEVLVLLKHVIVKNLQGDHLLGFSRSKGKGSNSLNVVSRACSSSVFSLVVHLDCGVHVTTLADDGDLEGANGFHDGVVRRVEHDAADAIVDLLLGLGLSSSGSGLSRLGLSDLISELLLESLSGVFFSSHLPGCLGTVVGTRFGSLGHNLLASLGFQLDQGDVGVLKANPLHRSDVLATVLLKLGQGRINVFVKFFELLSTTGLEIGLASQSNDALLLRFAEPLVAEHAALSNPGSPHGEREEDEGEQTLPGLDLAIGDEAEAAIEPDVGKHRPGGGDEEHTQMLDLPHFVVGDDIHAETDDHEKIEGGGSDNCSGSEVSRLEALGPDLNDGEHNLGSRRSKSHESQVGHCLVPNFDNDNLSLSSLGVGDGHLLLLGSDHFDGLHELVRDDGNTDEEVEHQGGVEKSTAEPISRGESITNRPERNHKTIFTVDTG